MAGLRRRRGGGIRRALRVAHGRRTASARTTARGPARRTEGQVRTASLRAQPAGNPPTAAKVALGNACSRMPSCPSTGTIACRSCHDPKLAFTDGESTGKGVTGKPLVRHTPTLWNVAWSPLLFWDGRAASLEDQIRFPVEHPDEMGSTLENGVARCRATTATCAPSPSLPARPAHHPRQHRQGAGGLRAHAGLAADPLRQVGRRRGGRADAVGGQRLRDFRRQGPLHQLPHRFRLHRPQLLRHRPARARTRDAGRSSGCPPPPMPSRCRPCASWPGPRPTCTTARWARWTTWCASTRWAASRGPTRAKDLPDIIRLTDQERADLVAFLESLSSETPPQPSPEAWVNARRRRCATPTPARHHGRQPEQQAVLPAARPPRARAHADHPQRRHPHPQRAHLRQALRFQLRRPGAARERDHPLPRPRHLRGLLRHPPLDAVDGRGAVASRLPCAMRDRAQSPPVQISIS